MNEHRIQCWKLPSQVKSTFCHPICLDFFYGTSTGFFLCIHAFLIHSFIQAVSQSLLSDASHTLGAVWGWGPPLWADVPVGEMDAHQMIVDRH